MTVAADTGTDEYANRITDTAEFKTPPYLLSGWHAG